MKYVTRTTIAVLLASLIAVAPAQAQITDMNGLIDIWYKSGWPGGRHHTTYQNLNIGGSCVAMWNETNGEFCEQNVVCDSGMADTDGDGFGDTYWETRGDNPRQYSNLCTDEPWYNNVQCYNTHKLNTVTWYRSCPREKMMRLPAHYYVQLRAKYIGPGRNYDPNYGNYDNSAMNTDDIWLYCTYKQNVSPSDPNLPADLQAEYSADFTGPNPSNLSKFALMGCSLENVNGQWNPTLGQAVNRPDLVGKFPATPADCIGTPPNVGPVMMKFECRPANCNPETLEGCDMPQGLYEFYVGQRGLKPAISAVGPGPNGCPHPAFEDSDFRYCGNKPGGCTIPGSNECRYAQNSYWTGVTKDGTPIPEQRLFISSVAVTIGQPKEWVDGSGNKRFEETTVMVADFSNPAQPGVVVGASPEVYFPDETPASRGVLVLKPGDVAFFNAGVTPAQVRSMECPKRRDAYVPIQNIALGQTEWLPMEEFYDQDTLQSISEKPGHPIGGDGDSCDLVERVVDDLPNYNILSTGQDGFGLTHSVSTAVNQLLENLGDNTIPILTVALTEPVRDCILQPGAAANGSVYTHQVGNTQHATKWGSNGNFPNGGNPGDNNNDGRLRAVRCLADKFTDAYPQALKDAAMRVKDAGGFVITIALSCVSDKFRDTLVDMSTGDVNLLNFSPEGVILDDACQAAAADGKIDPAELAASMYFVDVDENDNLFFKPAFAQATVDPLFGTINDVYAELAWVIVRDSVGREICANQPEGYCDDAR